MNMKAEMAESKVKDNPMREVKIVKVLLSAGGIDQELAKSKKLLEMVSGMKAQIIASRKRIGFI